VGLCAEQLFATTTADNYSLKLSFTCDLVIGGMEEGMDLTSPEGISGVVAVAKIVDTSKQTHACDMNGSRNEEKESGTSDPHVVLELGRKIGEGGFATVYIGKYYGAKCAVKVLKSFEDTGGSRYSGSKTRERNLFVLEALKGEIKVMQRLSHPNVVHFYDSLQHNGSLCVVMELCTGGSLWNVLLRERLEGAQLLTLEQKTKILCEIALGMKYLHSRKPPIIHRDLKSANCLLDGTTTAKLTDFGISRTQTDEVMLNTAAGSHGTVPYMAPELLNEKKHDQRVDVYAFGMVIFETLARRIPFEGVPQYTVISRVCYKAMRPELPEDAKDTNTHPLGHLLRSTMVRCWAQRADDRPAFAELTGVLCVGEPAQHLSVGVSAVRMHGRVNDPYDAQPPQAPAFIRTSLEAGGAGAEAGSGAIKPGARAGADVEVGGEAGVGTGVEAEAGAEAGGAEAGTGVEACAAGAHQAQRCRVEDAEAGGAEAGGAEALSLVRHSTSDSGGVLPQEPLVRYSTSDSGGVLPQEPLVRYSTCDSGGVLPQEPLVRYSTSDSGGVLPQEPLVRHSTSDSGEALSLVRYSTSDSGGVKATMNEGADRMKAAELDDLAQLAEAGKISSAVHQRLVALNVVAQQPVMKGWLEKRGEGLTRHWKHYWFLLIDHKLSYFQEPLASVPRCVISLHNCHILPDIDCDSTIVLQSAVPGVLIRSKKSKGGEASKQGKHSQYFLRADNSSSRDQWLAALRRERQLDISIPCEAAASKEGGARSSLKQAPGRRGSSGYGLGGVTRTALRRMSGTGAVD
jgi:serine/threonine protein kinase